MQVQRVQPTRSGQSACEAEFTGQAIETMAITTSVYLAISISISLLMNWYNKRIALIER